MGASPMNVRILRDFGRILTSHLRGSNINVLFVEGLGIAVLALALQASFGTVSASIGTNGTNARIDRAIVSPGATCATG